MESIKNWKKGRDKRGLSNRTYSITKKYGILPEEYDEIWEMQRGRCAICGISEDELKRSFHIDHDHETGKIRGLLCVNCNFLIGHSRENKDTLLSAYKYLSKNGR